MKRILTVALVFMMLFACAACNTEAAKPPRNPNPASDFEYEISDSGVSITKYIGTAADVVIPDSIENMPVSGIYMFAFHRSDIKSVDIPDTVIGIGNAAFYECKNLETVKFGANIIAIEEYAFYNCTSLKEAYLPKTLKMLKTKAFAGCTSLETVFIPASLTIKTIVWSMETFSGAAALKNIIFEDGVKTLGPYATFYKCVSLEKIIIPDSIERMGDPAFLGCINLKEIVFNGDAPEFNADSYGCDPFGIFPYASEESKSVKIYYHADKKGWDTTPLRSHYTLIPIKE